MEASERGGAGQVQAAEFVVPCRELEPTLAFFTERLGFRVAAIRPADSPRAALLVGHGLRLRLQKGTDGAPGTLRLFCREPAALAGGAAELLAPNGTRVEIVASEPARELPPLRPSLVVTRAGGDARWSEGRAGMRYRDLIPGRQGGRFVASHVRIEAGGPVPDYVHYHEVRFQMIYCLAGWARVVYEDQGPPFELRPGDCVLQPPRIRHRVLEASPGLEVLELGCPADHETLADLELALPTPRLRPERDFSGQRFLRHQGAAASWGPWREPGLEARELGLAEATGGAAGGAVVRAAGPPVPGRAWRHDAELLFGFVLGGRAALRCAGRPAGPLAAGDAFVVPAGMPCALADVSPDFELLEVALPAGFRVSPAPDEAG